MHKQFLKFATGSILALGITLSVAQAQDQQAPPPQGRRGGQTMDPEQQIQRMRDQLKLTDDQVSQIRPILADARKQGMALRSDSTMAPEDKRAKMQSIRQDANAKVRAVLTDDQKTQYDQMLQQRRQEQQSGNAGAPPNQ